MLRRGFLKHVNIMSINLGSEDVTRLDGTRGIISIIEILLSQEELEGEELEEAEEVA
jgi:DNA-binding protein